MSPKKFLAILGSTGVRWLFLVIVLVLVARALLFFVWVPYTPEVQNRDHYYAIARSLLDKNGFSVSDGEPTNLRPPMAPYFYAGVMWLFGDHTYSIAFSNWIVDAATCVLLYLIALEIFRDKQVALTSSLLYALYTPEMYYSWQCISEPLFTLLLAAFVLGFLRALRSPSIVSFAIAGLFLGLASLTRSTMLYFLPVAVVMLIWLLHAQGKEVIKWAAVLCLSLAVTVTPWTIHKYLTFGEFIPGDSNTGATLYHGTRALGEPDFLQYRISREGDASLRQLLRVRLGSAYGEWTQPEFDRLALEEAIKIIREYPGRYLLLSAVRFIRMWYFIEGPRASLSYAVLPLHITLVVLAAFAFLRYRGEWAQQGVFLIVLILFLNVGSAAVRTNVRYIVSVVPYLMLFAAVVIVDVLHRIRHRYSGRLRHFWTNMQLR